MQEKTIYMAIIIINNDMRTHKNKKKLYILK